MVPPPHPIEQFTEGALYIKIETVNNNTIFLGGEMLGRIFTIFFWFCIAFIIISGWVMLTI